MQSYKKNNEWQPNKYLQNSILTCKRLHCVIKRNKKAINYNNVLYHIPFLSSRLHTLFSPLFSDYTPHFLCLTLQSMECIADNQKDIDRDTYKSIKTMKDAVTLVSSKNTVSALEKNK